MERVQRVSRVGVGVFCGVQLLWEKLRLKATPLPEKQEKIGKFLQLMTGKVALACCFTPTSDWTCTVQ